MKNIKVIIALLCIVSISSFSAEEVIENSDYSISIEQNNVKEKSITNKNTKVNIEKGNESNFSKFQEEKKINSNAGQNEIIINGTRSNEIQRIYISDDYQLSSVEPKTNKYNTIDVLNNKIIATNEGIIQTLGGYDTTTYVYRNLDDAINLSDGVPVSGAGFDGQYIETIEENGTYYAHIIISGLDGYINVNNIQIIPSLLIRSQSHYENIGGEWTFLEAINPLESDDYIPYVIGEAPEWSKEGINYYSYDDENFYEDNIINLKSSESKTYSTYFQNLPFTSTADYSVSQYKSYLKYKGMTSSQYYNATKGFTDAQNLESINSLFLMAMADHESYYGTSNFAYGCNNFFGYGAYDSNPENGCTEYGYSTARDGILAQSLHLTQIWGDVTDWRFAGTEVGNKSHGLNVYYASDPDWGKKISSHMYDIDQYLGKKELNKYRIYEIKTDLPVFTSSSFNNKLKVTNGSYDGDYYMFYTGEYNPRVIVTAENSSGFEFQLPTPKNKTNSTTCKWSDAIKGSYPNFGSTSSISVPKDEASFACQYGTWSQEQGWFKKKNGSSNTYSIIADNTITTLGDTDVKRGVENIYWQDSGKLHIDGYSFIEGFDYKSASSIKHSISFVNTKSGKEFKWTTDGIKYSGDSSAVINNGYLNQYVGFSRDYNISELLTAGTYDVKIKTYIDKDYNGTAESGYTRYLPTPKGFTSNTITKFDKNLKYYDYNGNIRIQVTNNPQNVTLKLEDIHWTTDGNLYLKGFGFKKSYNYNSEESIKHQMSFINSKTGEEYKWTRNGEKYTGSSATVSNNGYIGKYVGFEGLYSISNHLKPGTYDVYLRTFIDRDFNGTLESRYTKELYSSGIEGDKITYKGRSYEYYTVDNILKLRVKEV